MGLDVTAYNGLSKIDCVYDEDGDPIDPVTREPLAVDYVQVYLASDFPGRADDLTDRGVYTYADAFGFRAGSYGGYNRWRNDLAAMAGWPVGQYEQYGKAWDSNCVACWNGATGPFSELINFTDCDGTIGSTVAAKLAKDFADFQAKADQFGDDVFRSQYAKWRQAFDLAANSGCVRFH